jgi:hypothetical protein
VAEPVPELEPAKRPVLSPDPEQTWRPEQRRRPTYPIERRRFWQRETAEYVLLLMVVVALIMLVMFGMLVSNFVHAAHTANG